MWTKDLIQTLCLSRNEPLISHLVVTLSDRLSFRIVGCVTVHIISVTTVAETELIPFPSSGPAKSLLQGKINFPFSDQSWCVLGKLEAERGSVSGLNST